MLVWSASPQTIGFQGRLLAGDGSPVPDDTYSVILSIWDDSTGGSQYWTETQTAPTYSGGLNVAMGDVNAIDYDGFPERNFPEDRQLGLIAQKVMEVAPEAVSKDNDGYYSVDYTPQVPILVEAVKGQQKTIESLQSTLEENTKEIEKLKSAVQKQVSGQDDAATVVSNKNSKF